MKTEIIACVNQKGGVGKSTTCINLGVGLAQEGRKVLLLDADAQASMTIGLGYPQPDQLPTTLSDVMGKVLTDEPISFREGILHHPEGIDLTGDHSPAVPGHPAGTVQPYPAGLSALPGDDDH